MAFKKFNTKFWLRLIFLQLSMAALAYSAISKTWYVTSIVLLILVLAQAFAFLRQVSKTNKKVALFLSQADAKDYTISFTSKNEGSGFDQLHESMNLLISRLKESRIDKEAQFMLFSNMIRNLNTGILVVNKDEEILLSNPALHSMLQTPEEKSWPRFRKRNIEVSQILDSLKNEERKITWLNTSNDRRQQVLITKRKFHINTVDFSFYSFQNIHKELEKKEIESWHKLIRILTHEIMNSVSPVVSLSSTLKLLLQNSEDKDGTRTIDKKVFEDIELSANTIQNRSKGLMEFIEEYSKLTRIPKPKIEEIKLGQILKELSALLSEKIKTKGVDLEIQLDRPDLKIKGDTALLEQVLLNLLNNAIEATSDTNEPKISIKAGVKNGFSEIVVSDNGSGVDEGDPKRYFSTLFYDQRKWIRNWLKP